MVLFTLLFCFVCRLGSVDSRQNILSRMFCPELFIVSSNLFTSHRHCGYPFGAYHKIDDTILEMVSATPLGSAAVPQSTLFLEALTPFGVSVSFCSISQRRTTSALFPRGLAAPLGRITCKPVASFRDEA